MQTLALGGSGTYETPSEALDYIITLIQGQADAGAAYIAVNVDAFGETDPALAVERMREYAKLVAEWGRRANLCRQQQRMPSLSAD